MRYDGPPGLMLDLLGPSPDGLDIEWIHPYTYANNNPHRFVDPSGFQAAPAGNMPCHDCECEKCTVLMGGRDIIDVPDNRKCRVEITCQEGNCQGLPGSTGTPTLEKDDQGNPQWVIQVCVQCGWHPANLIIEHELIHALQFCRGDKITDCASCKKFETEAHKKNCGIAFKGKPKAIKQRCYQCGVNISCEAKCGNVVPYPAQKACNLEALGVTQDKGNGTN